MLTASGWKAKAAMEAARAAVCADPMERRQHESRAAEYLGWATMLERSHGPARLEDPGIATC